MEIVKWLSAEGEVFRTICDWNAAWWGHKTSGREEVECFMSHSLCDNRLPQTFVALESGVPVGMYQFLMSDDLAGRPDIYPWLANVYVDVSRRGEGIGRRLMESVRENAVKAGLTELYLYTHHVGLYEKFGWEFAEEVSTFDPDSPKERLYRLTITERNEER